MARSLLLQVRARTSLELTRKGSNEEVVTSSASNKVQQRHTARQTFLKWCAVAVVGAFAVSAWVSLFACCNKQRAEKQPPRDSTDLEAGSDGIAASASSTASLPGPRSVRDPHDKDTTTQRDNATVTQQRIESLVKANKPNKKKKQEGATRIMSRTVSRRTASKPALRHINSASTTQKDNAIHHGNLSSPDLNTTRLKHILQAGLRDIRA